MFNNYSLTPNSKWITIQKGLYEKILIKQGFTNFEYVVVDDKSIENAVDGNFTKPK
jgi:hypothetical protein